MMENNFNINASIIIDTCGLRCPLPALKVQKDLKTLKLNEVALIVADDPLARIDLRHFCSQNKYLIEELKDYSAEGKQHYLIKIDE